MKRKKKKEKKMHEKSINKTDLEQAQQWHSKDTFPTYLAKRVYLVLLTISLFYLFYF
jgi:hypothetical protein